MTPFFKMAVTVHFYLPFRLSVSPYISLSLSPSVCLSVYRRLSLVISCHEAAAKGKNELLSRCVPNVDIDLNYL